jgi:aminoglycoside phosphotransferase family enzyme/predicted kinase
VSLVDDLRAGASEIRETHISWVFLFDTHVFKLKKPVNFGFLDFTTLEGRRAACKAEVTLNRRLAPGVYLGVVPVLRSAAGRYRFGEEVLADGAGSAPVGAENEECVDYAVQMLRLSDEDRADVRLARGQFGRAEIEQLATLLSRFHASAAAGPEVEVFGRRENIARNVQENFVQARDALAAIASDREQREVEERQLGFLSSHAALFDRRILERRIRDGHGDLRLEHVYFQNDEAPRVIDCIEFNERFRHGDVCADIAFLSMDLAVHDRVLEKERLVAAYARESGDHDLYALLDFYESYRAYVRAKIAAIGYSSPGPDLAARRQLEHDARRHFSLALACERPPLELPRLIAIGGIIASGKSTLADALGYALGAPVISSDRTRKWLAGVSPTTVLGGEAGQGAYSEERSAEVYAEVLRRAEVVLRSGRSVLIDASFRSQAFRERARVLAQSLAARFAFLECRAPREQTLLRLRQRAQGPSISDGRAELLDAFCAGYEPVVLGPDEYALIDTSGPLERSRSMALAFLDL